MGKRFSVTLFIPKMKHGVNSGEVEFWSKVRGTIKYPNAERSFKKNLWPRLEDFFHPWVSQPKFKLKPQKTYTVRLSCGTRFQSQGMWQEEYNRVLKSRSANLVVKSCNGNQRCHFSQCHCRLWSVLIFNKSTEC